MKNLLYLISTSILLTVASCRTDFSTFPNDGHLEFSKNKVYLDTIFTNIGSSTYMLKVYNSSNKDLNIPTIKLGKGNASKYRLMVDGMTGNQGKNFDNVAILAKDSLFVFIEITAAAANANPTDFTYTDQILFDSGSNQQSVDLITLIKDAKFIYPNRTLSPTIVEKLTLNIGNTPTPTDIIGHTLTDADFSPVGSWHFTNLKPTVIYGYALIPNGKTLTIDDGANVHFHADTDSGLIIDSNASLVVNGSNNVVDSATGIVIAKHEVTFEADRLEPDYEDAAGQWGTILQMPNSNATINHLTLKNATVGILTYGNIIINNSQIYNNSFVGIWGRNANITGKNLVINNAGQTSLSCSWGGNYDFNHCTFNNNWSNATQLAVNIDDYFAENKVVKYTYNLSANFRNCIIYNHNNIGLILDKKGTNFASNFKNCLIRFDDANAISTIKSDPIYNIVRDGNPANVNNIINNAPKFKNETRNQLNILSTSPAIGKGNTPVLFNNILNQARTNPTDIGAYNKP